MDSSSNSSAEILDSLSELPDFLTTAILSLLPMTDVVATMLLSKRWLHLWTTVPCLDFGNYHHPMFRNNLHKYEAFVSGALAHWKGSRIQKLSFTFDVDDDSHAIVDSWLLFAIEKQVEELRVSLSNDADHREYCAPQRLYSCSSITKMSLSSCKLMIDEAVRWSRLKSLKIRGWKALSEDAMNRILAGAPLLEALVLGVVDVSENLNIRSTSLKNLKIGVYGETLFEAELRIWAPNLLNLKISGFFYGTCLLDVPSLTMAELWFQESLDGETNAILPPVQMFYQVFKASAMLRFSHCHVLAFGSTLFKMKRNEMVVEFPNAKSLYLRAGRGADMLRVLDMFMFPNLAVLWVQHDQEVFANLESVEEAGLKAGISNIDVFCSRVPKEVLPSPSVPYLKMVWISWIMRDVSIIQAAEILLESAKLLEKMVFTAVWYNWSGEKPELLLSKSASSPTAEVVVIDHP